MLALRTALLPAPVKTLTESGRCKSRTDARRLIESGVWVGDQGVTDIKTVLEEESVV